MAYLRTSTVSVAEWKKSFLQDIENASDTTAKGNMFVQRILSSLYGYSLDDAIDATACAGAGDHGVDALIITEPEDEGGHAEALVVQGKYGQAGLTLSPYQESRKYIKALQRAAAGESITDAIDRCASVLKNGGIVRYVIATVDPLDTDQVGEIDDVRVLARGHFGDRVLVETVSLDDVRDTLADSRSTSITVKLQAMVVQPTEDTFVGVASLINIYRMMREYATINHNNVDAIYDRNVRKWLKRRAGSVNGGIYQTLEVAPDRFIAFNNGITLICDTIAHVGDVLELVNPYIVNGCQTTRTLYDFVETKFAGKCNQLATDEAAAPYRSAFLPFRVIAHADDSYRKDITRYSNKQNALRGKDFLSLEDTFSQLQSQARQQGYFLQVQAGEYDALPKHEQAKFPRGAHVIDAFDALRYYASAVLSKPNTAFGRSGQFTPGGDEFNRTMEGITVSDLLVPWLIAQDANELGYSAGAKRLISPMDDHRNQTRYFYLYVMFRISSRIVFDAEPDDRFKLYSALQQLREDRLHCPTDQRKDHPFSLLLYKTDQCIKTYMVLARQQNWYSDRNAFLKSAALLLEEHYTMATVGPLTDIDELRIACRRVLQG